MEQWRKWLDLRTAFRACFHRGRWFRKDGEPSEEAGKVFAELREFCRADSTCFDVDPRVHAMLEGRREVWLKMVAILDLTDDQLRKMKELEDNG